MKKQKAVGKTAGSKRPRKTAEPVTANAEGKTLRKRVGNVRGLILGLLESGPMSSPALVSQGGFSPASVFLNIKALKQEGVVSAARHGREVLFSLTGAAPAGNGAVKVPKKRGPKPGSSRQASASRDIVLAYVPSELHAALNGLTRQLSPVEGLAEKLKVLDVLGQTLPPAIASVLATIANDLQRMSSADAPIPF